MAQSFQQTDGVALIELAIRVSDTSTVPVIGANVAFVKAEIIERPLGFSEAVFTLETSTQDYVDNLLRDAMATDTPRLRWRIGFGSSSNPNWTPWEDYIIRNYTAPRTGLGSQSGYTIQIFTADRLWEIDRINRVTARNGAISDIVQNIADFYKFSTVIEPTKKSESTYIQSFQSDYQFILRRMLPRAVNDRSRGNYQFFLRDGVLHFHTIDYQASLKDFSYFDSPGADLIQIDRTQRNLDIGSAGTRMVAYDPYTGETSEILSDTANSLKLANTSPDIEKVAGARLNLFSHVGTNRISSIESIASNLAEAAQMKSYSLKLVVPKTLFFRANDLVRMVVQPNASTTPPWNGYYYVGQVAYTVDKTSIMATVDFYRGEYNTNSKTFTPLAQLGENVIQPQRAAAGHDPNFAAVAASNVTKGSGNTVSRSLLLDTNNPNSALTPG